jgi:hydrogenase-4 component F
MLTALLVIPVAWAALAWLLPARWLRSLGVLVGAAVLGLAIALVAAVLEQQDVTAWHGILEADSLSAVIVLTTSVVVFGSSLHTLGYYAMHPLTGRRQRLYSSLWAAFAVTMLAAPLFVNLGALWMLVELTTLSSVFLVAFEGRRESLEAAWKYAVIVTVGVSLALLGTILLYYAATPALGDTFALTWPNMLAHAGQLTAGPLELAFLLALVGYGTKTGLAPMHTWLPDAHSEAPAPISAMLSGCLLNTALYGILRFSEITRAALGGYVNAPLIAFGLFSLLVAVFSLRSQTKIKRLLAYSSVEHMGIITLAFGLGAPFFAFLQLFNHSLTKAMLFFAAGNATLKRGPDIDSRTGLFATMPVTASALLLGGLAITGAPPFNLFPSEFGILRAAWAKAPWLAWVYLLLLLVVFIAFLGRLTVLLFGERGWPRVAPGSELGIAAGVEDETPEPRDEAHPLSLAPVLLFLAAILIFSLFTPGPLTHLFSQAGHALGGGP